MHNKPLGCGASEVYASGPACEEEEEHHLYPVLVSNDSLSIAINMLYKSHVQRVFFVSLGIAAVTKTLSPLKAYSTRNLELIFPLLLNVPNVIEDVCFANLQFIRRLRTF